MEQLEKRKAKVEAVREQVAQNSAAQTSPKARRIWKEDSSSSEDTSDEAFLARHQPGEEEEHCRNYGPTSGVHPPS